MYLYKITSKIISSLILGITIATIAHAQTPKPKIKKVEKTDAEWKKTLTPDAYAVLRKEGTEAPFKNKYWDNHKVGTYTCAGCNTLLFKSDTKFESGTGWPSFFKPVNASAVTEKVDNSFGSSRTEVLCSTCQGHLGHVFDDGPKPTGLRYCMNSAALTFHQEAAK